MTDTKLLDEAIKKSGYKQSFIIEKMGISANAFNKKKRNITPFKVCEIQILIKLLCLTAEQVNCIFFATNVE